VPLHIAMAVNSSRSRPRFNEETNDERNWQRIGIKGIEQPNELCKAINWAYGTALNVHLLF